MATLGVTLAKVTPGEVILELPFRSDLTQQHGFLHAGIVTTVVDSACGYAALTLMDKGAAVLSVEFKVNLLSPARGHHFRAVGRVVRSGRHVTVVSGELSSIDREHSGLGSPIKDAVMVAMMTGTMMAVRDRPELVD
jgi:uncharacterized protein (TIGR00369 family)